MAKRPKDDLQGFNHPALHYQKPKELRRFQTALAFIASAALVFGLWSFAWYAMSAWAKSEITGWVEAQRSLGAVVDYASMETAGFPTRITLTLTAPRYEGPAFGTTVKWKSGTLTVNARPWTPWKLHLNAPDNHDVLLANDTLRFTGAAERFEADVVLGPVWPKSLNLRVQGLTMNGSAPLSIERLHLQAVHDPNTQAGGTGLSLDITGDNLVLPGILPMPLGDDVQNLDVAARVTGPVIPGALRERLSEWRDGGGAIEFERLKFRSGPLAVAAGGTATLDKNFQPQGAFTAKIEGLFQVMEILRARGTMRAGDAVKATMALSALSTRPKNGETPSINLSVTVQDGELSLGPLRVMKMPVFDPVQDWGLAPPPPVAEAAAEPQTPPRNYKDIKPVF